MKKVKEVAARYADDALFCAGVGFVAKAGFDVYPPAGWAVIGAGLIMLALMIGRGGK